MYAYQSTSEQILAPKLQEQPTTAINNNMQLLTSRLLFNLTRNVLQTSTKRALPLTNKGAIVAHNYCQKLVGCKSERCESQKPKVVVKEPESVGLLRYPALPLEPTIDRFLKSCEPLLDDDEMKITRKEAKWFEEYDGAELQTLLEEVAEKERNWLAHRWLRTAYLQYRDPVTVYSSPGMTFPMQEFKSDDAYFMYTAKVIFGLLKFKEMVDKGEIPVVKMGRNELDNSQFGRVFGTCRIPNRIEDCLEFNPDSKHIVIIHKNHFYKLEVYTKDGQIYRPEAIAKELTCITENETEYGLEYGVLTTDNRDNWAEAYSVLIKPPGNLETVRTIQTSLFTVSLDRCVDLEKGHEWTQLSEQLIHGGGSTENSCNRWMDKTIQLISNRNGMSGFTYEHSPAEGQPIAMIVDYVVANLKNDKFFDSGAGEEMCSEKLNLTSTPCMDLHIENAKRNVNHLAFDLLMNIMTYKGYGKEFLKSQKMSPDSFIQVALQYAYYKLHGEAAAQYESAHLRIFFDGRTETIRSCSPEVVDFAKAMVDDKEMTREGRIELLAKAVNEHRKLTTMALQGHGVDRHLLGLKLMAIENNIPIPKFYKTPGWLQSTYFRISTSQVATKNCAFMCYGPSVKDGYACCYNPRDNDIILSLASWSSNRGTTPEQFGAAITSALDSMWMLLTGAKAKPGAKAKL